MDSQDLVGQIFSYYRVLERLGRGGMGVVYRAADMRLDRIVAVKVLPLAGMLDPERRRRFAQEAKAASALNHPNIVIIYDIGMDGGLDYIAMEYVAGQTLHQLIGRTGLPLRDTLRYAVQIADALAAAHAAGIVHRDLKPGNIMVTEKGLVKVLDFGLAKWVEPQEPSDLTASLAVGPQTEQGTMVGTVAYMSPEQAEGKKVDSRSDIFSFGVVLYEMVTGRRPFQGETTMSTISAILVKEPSPLSELVGDVSRDLERLIFRCLRKEPERRVQHMDDLKVALEELKDESVTGRLISGVVSAPSGAVFAPVAARRRSKLLPALVVAVALLIVVGAVAWLWLRPRTAGPAVLTRLTSDSGLSWSPALSPDGKLLAYASDRSGEGNLDIWVQQIGGGEPIRLTRDEADETEPAFSPDGTKVAFRSEREGGGLYLAPALGGEARLLAPEGHRPRFSPGGDWILYWVGIVDPGSIAGSTKAYVIPANGGEPRQFHPEFANIRHAIWMPDGKHLLFLGTRAVKPDFSASGVDWWVAPVDGGTAVKTGALDPFRTQGLRPRPGEYAIVPGAVTTDGEHVLFAATLGDSTNLWQVQFSPRNWQVTGNAQRLTFGAGVEVEPALAAGSGDRLRVAFASLTLNVDLWSLPIDGNQARVTGPLQRLTQGVSVDAYPTVSADGNKIAYVSSTSGPSTVRLRDLMTDKDSVLVTSRFSGILPRISRDGSRVLYWEKEDNRPVIYAISARGGAAEKICNEDCGPICDLSGDGRELLLESVGRPALDVLDLASRRRVTAVESRDHPGYLLFLGRFSPDERWIGFHARTTSPVNRQIFIAPYRRGTVAAEKDWIAATDGSTADREVSWSPDGNSIYFLSDRDGFRCVWAQRLERSAKRPVGGPFAVQHFHHARRSLIGVGGSPAGIGLCLGNDRLVFAMAEITGNVWMREGAAQQ